MFRIEEEDDFQLEQDEEEDVDDFDEILDNLDDIQDLEMPSHTEIKIPEVLE